MADNRMYLECRACKKSTHIGRFTYYGLWDIGEIDDKFIEAHNHDWILPANQFQIRYEHGDPELDQYSLKDDIYYERYNRNYI